MYSAPHGSFGRWFTVHRQKQELTEKQLANALGLSEAQVSRYGRGMSRPRYKDVARIAAALNTSVGEAYRAAGFSPPPECVDRGALEELRCALSRYDAATNPAHWPAGNGTDGGDGTVEGRLERIERLVVLIAKALVEG